MFIVEEARMVTRYPIVLNDPIRLRGAVDRFFGEPVFRTLATNARSQSAAMVPVDVFATQSDLIVIATVPGLGPDDLEVTVDENVLTLSGEIPNVAKSTEAEGATWYLNENRHGRFRRIVTLPFEVDAAQAEATFEHGVLRLRLPKAEAAKPHRITIQSGQFESSAETPEIAENAG
jgi:HSP20 family protein